MCGIAGWVQLESEITEVMAATLEKRAMDMAALLTHRGPDDQGAMVLNNVALGHTRLSILDLSQNGHQPMSLESPLLAITFNGEIYNYPDLRQQYKEAGASFQSHTDTEVILQAYAYQGRAFVHHLEGMFAFALLDVGQNQLVLARDRLGKKPLYYTHDPESGFFAFASEPRALLSQPEVLRVPDEKGIACYEALGFVPAPNTGFKHIKALPAGHWAVFDTVKGDWVTPPEPYWDIHVSAPEKGATESFSNFKKETYTQENVPEAFETLMQESVRKRLQSDVPVGVLLSGGLDSTTIACVTRSLVKEPFHTFSVGFDVPHYDESQRAQTVAKTLGTQHHDMICTADDFLQVLPDVLTHVDNPLAEQLIPMFLVSKLAREHVTVVLSGDGADEVLGGYNSYAHVKRFQQWARMPFAGGLMNAAAAFGQQLFSGSHPEKHRKLGRLRALLKATPSHAYLAYRYSNTLIHDRALLLEEDSPLMLAGVTPADVYEDVLEALSLSSHDSSFDSHLYLDMKTNMVEAVLMKADRMAMASSLEVRCPFLDHTVMAFLFSLPMHYKHQHGQSKWLLRQFLNRHVPESIWQGRKQGFSAPFGYWLQHHVGFYEAIQSLLMSRLDPSLGVKPAGVGMLFEQHRQGKRDHSHVIWSLLIMAHWYQQFVLAAPAEKAGTGTAQTYG